MLVLGRSALPALMAVTLAATAGAQQKACEIDEGQPNQVARAMLDLQLVQNAKPEVAAKSLKDAVKLLHEGDQSKNPVGRSLVLGKTLVTWMSQPGMESGMTTRGAIGLATEPEAPYDLIANIDSAFTIVEKSNPECESQTAPWRQQKGWVDMVNQAMQLGDAGGKADSAALVAKRSLQLYRGAPYGYMVLAKVASEKNDPKGAIAFYKQAIGVATDTSAQGADNRRMLQMTIGNYAADLYEAASDADKPTYMAEAKAAYEALAKDPGTKYADAARSGQARLAQMSGDTTAIKATYSEQLANPGAFSYASLMNAAVTAAKTSQTKDAIKLFEAARQMNSYHRDVLYNLARLYLLDSATDKSLEMSRQLVQVDPANPDNDQLIAIAYGNLAKGYDAQVKAHEARAKALGQKANAPRTAAAVAKANIDSAAKETPIIKAYADSSKTALDSLLKYNARATEGPVRVVFNEFTPADNKTTIGGTVTNNTDAEKTYTMKVSFVDKAGTVVTTQDVSVGPVAPKASGKFTATGEGAGIMAFKYTITP